MLTLNWSPSFGKTFWLIFKNFLLKFLDFGKKKNGWFHKILEKFKKKKTAKTENLGLSRL